MKIGELTDLPDGELQKKLQDLRGELFNLRFQRATGHLENPMRFRAVRKDIARVMTVMAARQPRTHRVGGSR